MKLSIGKITLEIDFYLPSHTYLPIQEYIQLFLIWKFAIN
jgi:hypothetical protein